MLPPVRSFGVGSSGYLARGRDPSRIEVESAKTEAQESSLELRATRPGAITAPGRDPESPQRNNGARHAGPLPVREIPSVLRRGCVREDLVVGHVVEIQIVACWTTNDWR